MHEAKKIREATFFYLHMAKTEKDSQANDEEFTWFLSAFLCAGLSVLQYAEKEAKKSPSGKQWFKRVMSGSRLLKFFWGKRDLNIHEKPVETRREIKIDIGESMDFWADAEAPLPATPTLPSAFVAADKFTFDDWSGSEGVLQLSEVYLRQLGKLVQDGQRNGFLTP